MIARIPRKIFLANEELLSRFEIQDWNLKTFANEIYENIGQILSLAKMEIANVNPDIKEDVKKAVERSDRLLEKAIKDLRKLAKLLSPAEIMQKGFAASLSCELDKLKKLGLCSIAYKFSGTAFRLEEIRELILFSIIQHYIMKALYVEEIRSINVGVQYKVSSVHIRISYIENGKKRDGQREKQGEGISRRASLIGATIRTKYKTQERWISISIKK